MYNIRNSKIIFMDRLSKVASNYIYIEPGPKLCP